MNLNKIRAILKIMDNPEWAVRDPDPQQAPSKLANQGLPVAPKSPEQPQAPAMNQTALKKAADTLLMGGEPQQGTAPTNASPEREGGANTTLSQALRNRRLNRQMNETMPLPGRLTFGGRP